MSSPTQRSLKYLRDAGWTACIVEKFNSFCKIRFDAFGFGDVLAMRTEEIALVQTTTSDNMAARRTKILSLTEAAEWKAAGGIILLHGWSKKGARGKRKLWTVNEERL